MESRTKWPAFFPLLFALWVAFQAEPGVRTDVQLVLVDTLVTEKGTGKVLDTLSPQDFEILDDGKLRSTQVFEVESTPLDPVFLVDTTGWAPPREPNEFRRALHEAVGEIRPGDRAAVLFAVPPYTVQAMTENKATVRKAMNFVGTDHLHGAGLYDAVQAAEGLFPRPYDLRRRRAIIAISDDRKWKSRTGLDSLITDVLESDVTLNEMTLALPRDKAPVGIFGLPIAGVGSTRGDLLLDAVEATGGEAIPGDQFREQFRNMIRRIRTRYLIGFYAEPGTAREFHRIEVKLSKEAQAKFPNALVRARRGYYSRPPARDPATH